MTAETARRGPRLLGRTPVLTEETQWELFHDAFLACELICRELAKYQYYWDARTVWLMEHAGEAGTPRFEERRAKRNAMATRWNELRLDFQHAARMAQGYAEILGPDRFETIWERYGVDYRRQRGDRMDIYLTQWREWLTFNPETCPF